MPRIEVETVNKTTKFDASMDRMTQGVRGFQNQLKAVGQQMVGAFAVGALINLGRQATRTGSEISDMAISVGVSAEQFQVLEIAAIKAGRAPAVIQKALTQIALKMGQAQRGMKTYVDLFSALGISMDKVRALNTAEMLEEIATQLGDAEQGTVRFGAAVEILGARSGAGMLEILREIADVGLAGMSAEMKNAGLIMSNEMIDKLDKLEDKMLIAGRQTKLGFGAGLVWAQEAISATGMVAGALWGSMTDDAISFMDTIEGLRAELKPTKDEPGARAPGIDPEALKEAEERFKVFKKLTEDNIKKRAALEMERLTTVEQIRQIEMEIAKLGEARRNDSEQDALSHAEITGAILDREQQLVKLQEKQKKEQEKAAKERLQAREKEADVIKKAEEKVGEILEGKGLGAVESITDRLAAIGGEFGAAASPQLRFAQRQVQIDEALLAVNQQAVNELAEIKQKIDEGGLA
jgi:hypothetical protein